MIFTLRNCLQRIKWSNQFYKRNCRSLTVFGIETSCDDTGCAVVNEKGNILGESRYSQAQQHWDNGGITPTFAADLHRSNMKKSAEEALNQAKISLKDVDAVAVTVKPGIPCSINIGVEYAKDMCTLYQKPLVPIHHMQAHALTVRMLEKVEFPFLVLLISGGHCILALANSVDEFLILGESIDIAPGQIFDKAARRLKLNFIKKFKRFNGGALIEQASLEGDPLSFQFGMQLTHVRNCDFSWSGLLTRLKRHIDREEEEHKVEPDQVIPNVYDLCASFQYNLTKHLCQRIQRAMEFIDLKNLIPQEEKCLVVSGGVASNQFIRKLIQHVCDEYGYKLHVPPPKLCTDNGAMIAWNAIERLNANIAPVKPNELDSILIEHRSPMGKNISDLVVEEDIKCQWIKLDKFVQENMDNSLKISKKN